MRRRSERCGDPPNTRTTRCGSGELGFPTPRAVGIVQITPEREFMIVMEFFDDAVETGDAEIDAGVIDQGLELIHRMWDQDSPTATSSRPT